MKKIIGLSLVFCAFSSVASGAVSGEIQPYPDYLSAYVKTLVTAGCEQALKGSSEDALINSRRLAHPPALPQRVQKPPPQIEHRRKISAVRGPHGQARTF
ncbi:TPA: hypothetical protein ACV5CR_001340 [Klebsiella aerogenes]|uniref:hypothetical protein n=1 Tax=Klebsiella aerogenes TaxID=548 RepID=UPI002E64434E|nr:hypothetical protein [Klebsiella aerogenes]HBR6987109.1 hypothetical protein [Klebsiella aerogenes]